VEINELKDHFVVETINENIFPDSFNYKGSFNSSISTTSLWTSYSSLFSTSILRNQTFSAS